jgi:hypothetical protein
VPNIDLSGVAERDQITIAAVARAAGRGLLTATEAASLIERLRAHGATPSGRHDRPPEAGNLPGHSEDPDGTVR